MARRPLAAGFALAIGLTACGGSSSSNSPSTPTAVPLIGQGQVYNPSAASIPACAHAGKARHFPANFPASFPVPPGTAVTGSRVPIGGGIAATGFVPYKTFATSVRFIPNQLPRAGFKVLFLEVDAPHDSEGAYKGGGYLGGWSLRVVAGCPVMRFQASAKPLKTGT